MRTVSVKVASAVIAGLGLTAGAVGMVGAQVTGNLGPTGEDSENDVVVTSEDNREHNNDATVEATNNNPQTAESGEATVEDGEDDGTAESGTASNDSDFEGSVTVDQQGGQGGDDNNNSTNVSATLEDTGEDSENNLEVTHTDNRVRNNTANVTLTNNNTQNAVSGAATVQGGDDGGSATSGNATNTSRSAFTVNVQQ